MQTNQFRHSLWEFSLALYAQPGVAETCLALQNDHGVNVNILLWCAWLGSSGYLLDPESLAQAQVLIGDWSSHYIVPLRALRVQMKAEFGVSDTGIEAVRTAIKQAELQAEKEALSWLERYAQTCPLTIATDANKAALTNINLYLINNAVPTHNAATELIAAALSAIDRHN